MVDGMGPIQPQDSASVERPASTLATRWPDGVKLRERRAAANSHAFGTGLLSHRASGNRRQQKASAIDSNGAKVAMPVQSKVIRIFAYFADQRLYLAGDAAAIP